MIWWKINELKTQLSERKLSEAAKFSYLLMSVLLTSAFISFPISTYDMNDWAIGSGLMNLVLTAAGTVWLYRINGGSMGQNFLERYVSLSFVYFLRYSAIALPTLVLIYTVAYAVGINSDEFNAFDLIISSICLAAYYLGLSKHIRDVV
jgi:hypothetical protein